MRACSHFLRTKTQHRLNTPRRAAGEEAQSAFLMRGLPRGMNTLYRGDGYMLLVSGEYRVNDLLQRLVSLCAGNRELLAVFGDHDTVGCPQLFRWNCRNCFLDTCLNFLCILSTVKARLKCGAVQSDIR